MEASDSRVIVAQLEKQFGDLIAGLRVAVLQTDQLYTTSFGENVLRSAAAVEQLFGGLTANLWDDPFEWTLPETLTTPQLVADYLAEVDATRVKAFASIRSDAELLKRVASPSFTTPTLFEMLLETLLLATRYQDRAKSFLPQG